jgi:TPR repeat protein
MMAVHSIGTAVAAAGTTKAAMSSKNEAGDTTMLCCASCGAAGVDDVKLLKKCECGLVNYCSIACQKNHREHHEEECKKRLAELRDEILFKQPDGSHLGDCPICCLPLPISVSNVFIGCCSKIICNGCDRANQKREREAGLKHKCAFCREPLPETQEAHHKRMMERVKKSDPVAMRHMAKKCQSEGDYDGAFEYYTKAAELGDASSHFNLSALYEEGECVEKDVEKEVHHLEQAAIAGHPNARFNLGCEEANNGRFERAKKHWIIAANLGHEVSLKAIRVLYADGHASKEEYADALRAYQAAVEAAKSCERGKAEAFVKNVNALKII